MAEETQTKKLDPKKLEDIQILLDSVLADTVLQVLLAAQHLFSMDGWREKPDAFKSLVDFGHRAFHIVGVLLYEQWPTSGSVAIAHSLGIDVRFVNENGMRTVFFSTLPKHGRRTAVIIGTNEKSVHHIYITQGLQTQHGIAFDIEKGECHVMSDELDENDPFNYKEGN